MNGKQKCKILRQIRREIARQNDISYMTAECQFQGACTGTCPKCEAELKYLERELAVRKKAGKAVAVAGIAAAMLAGATACRAAAPEPAQTPDQTENHTEATEVEDVMSITMKGLVAAHEEEEIETTLDIIMGTMVEWELTGDVPEG